MKVSHRLGVIGYPLTHSISPAIHQGALDHLGMRVRYEVWETPPDGLSRLLDRLREDECLGASVTIPYKETVVPLMDELSQAASSIGAVNCIVSSNGRLIGHNTDCDGFARALTICGKFSAGGKRALLIGAGGAARAIGRSLVDMDVASLTIMNRTPAKAECLADELSGVATAAPTDLLGHEDAARAELIVNSTSVGMSSGGRPDDCPIAPNLIPANSLVNDIVYSPAETPLLRAAKSRGARTLGGLPMLIFQGAAAFEMWTGTAAPVEVMFGAGRRALGMDP